MPAQAGIQTQLDHSQLDHCLAGSPLAPGRAVQFCYAASAFFSDALIAPDAVISPISFSE
jgi:hypothetical protein